MKKIRISETQFNRVIKGKINEQEMSTRCQLCVAKALGPKYTIKAMKIAKMLEKMQEEGTPPELEDIIKLMDGIDMMDTIEIGPKLLNCYDKCQPKGKTPEKQLEEGLRSTLKGIGGAFRGTGYHFSKYSFELKKELIRFNKQLRKTFDRIEGIYDKAEDSRMSNKGWDVLKNHIDDAKDAYEMTYDTNNVIINDIEHLLSNERKKDGEKTKEKDSLGDVKVEPQFKR